MEYKSKVRFLPNPMIKDSTRINRILHYTHGFIKSSRREEKVRLKRY